MKTALILTTINIPTVLELYRRHGSAVAFFVAGDEKSPHDEIEKLFDRIGGYICYLPPDAQTQWKCSELIGWNVIARRNVALLEALKWGAAVIVSIDDDVIPLRNSPDVNYFDRFRYALTYPFDGIRVSSPSGWYDPGQLLTPAVRHRGLPMEVPTMAPRLDPVVDARVGVAAGLWIGDADVNATHRVAVPPEVHSVTELGQTGVVVDPGTRTMFNTQSVAFLRELAPAMFMNPYLKRYDDIVASLITQRVMRDKGMHVHFGKPFAACWQDRSKASLLRDIEDEMWGMRHVKLFSNYLDKNPPGGDGWSDGGNTIEYLRAMYDDLKACAWWPEGASEVALAFLEDIEGVM